MIREYIIKISDEVFEDECAGNPPELVRCKDCAFALICDDGHKKWIECKCHYEQGYDPEEPHPLDWFCADGERKQ